MDVPLTKNYYKSNKSKVVISAGLKPATHSLGLMMGFEPTNDIGPQINLLPTAFTLWLHKSIRHSGLICMKAVALFNWAKRPEILISCCTGI